MYHDQSPMLTQAEAKPRLCEALVPLGEHVRDDALIADPRSYALS